MGLKIRERTLLMRESNPENVDFLVFMSRAAASTRGQPGTLAGEMGQLGT